jgi:hypothetical protein
VRSPEPAAVPEYQPSIKELAQATYPETLRTLLDLVKTAKSRAVRARCTASLRHWLPALLVAAADEQTFRGRMCRRAVLENAEELERFLKASIGRKGR